MPTHKEIPLSDKWDGTSSLELRDPKVEYNRAETYFDKSINPWDDTKRELPISVKSSELKMATSGLNIDLRKHIEDSIQNTLEMVNTPRNTLKSYMWNN